MIDSAKDDDPSVGRILVELRNLSERQLFLLETIAGVNGFPPEFLDVSEEEINWLLSSGFVSHEGPLN